MGTTSTRVDQWDRRVTSCAPRCLFTNGSIQGIGTPERSISRSFTAGITAISRTIPSWDSTLSTRRNRSRTRHPFHAHSPRAFNGPPRPLLSREAGEPNLNPRKQRPPEAQREAPQSQVQERDRHGRAARQQPQRERRQHPQQGSEQGQGQEQEKEQGHKPRGQISASKGHSIFSELALSQAKSYHFTHHIAP